MALPKVVTPRDVVDVAGTPIEVRGLTRLEATKVHGKISDMSEFDAYLLATGCDVSEDEAREWLASVPFGVADKVVNKIISLSGLDDLGKGSQEA